MWCEAGQDPDAFWNQTPRSFQLLMRGYRARLGAEAESRMAQSWQAGMFAALAQNGKLKKLDHYLKKPPRKMGNAEMLANMRILAQRANRLNKES